MSEDEIYNYLISFISSKIKQHKLILQDMAGFNLGYLSTEELQKAVQGLMDLRKAEKEKNKWKPISKYNREKYDWVLVKYFDGEYECVPEVAEQRCDGKWYTTEREIPFEVKYFFDIQELLEE